MPQNWYTKFCSLSLDRKKKLLWPWDRNPHSVASNVSLANEEPCAERQLGLEQQRWEQMSPSFWVVAETIWYTTQRRQGCLWSKSKDKNLPDNSPQARFPSTFLIALHSLGRSVRLLCVPVERKHIGAWKYRCVCVHKHTHKLYTVYKSHFIVTFVTKVSNQCTDNWEMCNWHSCFLPICSFISHKLSRRFSHLETAAYWEWFLFFSYEVNKNEYRTQVWKSIILIKGIKSQQK